MPTFICGHSLQSINFHVIYLIFKDEDNRSHSEIGGGFDGSQQLSAPPEYHAFTSSGTAGAGSRGFASQSSAFSMTSRVQSDSLNQPENFTSKPVNHTLVAASEISNTKDSNHSAFQQVDHADSVQKVPALFSSHLPAASQYAHPQPRRGPNLSADS